MFSDKAIFLISGYATMQGYGERKILGLHLTICDAIQRLTLFCALSNKFYSLFLFVERTVTKIVYLHKPEN
jgi:hypothetical protein